MQPLSREIDADINAMTLASQASAKGRPDIILSPTDPADIWGSERRKEILNQYTGLANMGMGSASQGAQLAQNFGQNQSMLQQQAGQAQAQNALTQGGIWGNTLQDLGGMAFGATGGF